MFRAHDPVADRPVAVKLFTLDLAPERVHQFVTELKRLVAADLTHPALAAPIATGMHGVSAYLVQDFVAADSLDQVIREYGAAPAADALRVAAQLAGALDFANAVHVRHGALHPRDVLLSSDDTRMTGIGVAHALERIGIAAPVRRPYTPPERAAGGEWDRRSDIFSLATLTHELLWARRISGMGAKAAENLTAIPGGDLAALRAVFSRALAEDPSERFETALEFAEALRAAFPGMIVSSQPSPAVVQEFAVPAPPSDPRQTTGERPKAESPRLPLLDRDADLDLPISVIAQAEDDRYRDVEAAPAIVPRDVGYPAGAPGASRDADSAAANRTYLEYVQDDSLPIVAPTQGPLISPPIAAPVAAKPAAITPPVAGESSRAGMWPIALVVGLAVGFGAGYGLGVRQRPAPPAAAPAAEAAPVPAGREFTETAVTEPPTAPPPAADAPAVPPSADAAAKPEAASPAPEADGRLLVRTTPAGARVFVDGKDYGRTPAAVRNLSLGGHRVRVLRDGYAAEERRIVITSSQPAQSLTIPLERPEPAAGRGAPTARPAPPAAGAASRFTGDLFVVSRPPGATVFMDGKLVGTTPLTLRAVAAGSHAIRIEQDGFRRWSSAVRVVASQQNRVTASLER